MNCTVAVTLDFVVVVQRSSINNLMNSTLAMYIIPTESPLSRVDRVQPAGAGITCLVSTNNRELNRNLTGNDVATLTMTMIGARELSKSAEYTHPIVCERKTHILSYVLRYDRE